MSNKGTEDIQEQLYTPSSILYTVTVLFGVDSVKTRVYSDKKIAKIYIDDTINLLVESKKDIEIINNETAKEVYYILNKSHDPKSFIEIIFRECEIGE